jgi:hypothetical protein
MYSIEHIDIVGQLSMNTFEDKRNKTFQNANIKNINDIINTNNINHIKDKIDFNSYINNKDKSDNNAFLDSPMKIPKLLNCTQNNLKKDERNKNPINILLTQSQNNYNEKATIENKKEKKIQSNLKKSAKPLYENFENSNNKNKDNINKKSVIDISRNKNMNTFFMNDKKCNSYNLKSSINDKNITFDDDLIYICYYEKDKPTDIKLYQINNKKEQGISLDYKPRNIDCYLKTLRFNKKRKSILLNKDEYEKNLFRPLDGISNKKRTKKIINKKNIIKRNIDFIKKVENLINRESLNKNKESSLSKGKKKKSQEKNKKEKALNIIRKNININTSQHSFNNYAKIESIAEEEEGKEDSKFDKQINNNF